MQNISNEKEFDLYENEPVAFSYEWFHIKTPFVTEARGNSEMVCYTFNKKDARPITFKGRCSKINIHVVHCTSS